MGVIKQGVVLCLALTMYASVAAQQSPWSFGVGLSVLSDDNVTRAQGGDDIKKDTIIDVRGDGHYALNISANHGVTFSGFVQAEEYRDYDGVSNLEAGMEVEYRFRTRAGFTAPLYSFYIKGFQADYETDNRDGNTVEYGLRFRRRMTDRIVVAAGAGRSHRSADGRVFDLDRTRYFAHVDYRLTDRVQSYLAYYYVDGDTYSISSVDLTGAGGNYYEAVEWDPAFSADRDRWAYRLDAKTDIFRLGLNVGITGNSSIDLSIDAIDSEASGYGPYWNSGTWASPAYGGGDSINYDTTVIALGYLHRF